jgi:hypothetical protein
MKPVPLFLQKVKFESTLLDARLELISHGNYFEVCYVIIIPAKAHE